MTEPGDAEDISEWNEENNSMEWTHLDFDNSVEWTDADFDSNSPAPVSYKKDTFGAWENVTTNYADLSVMHQWRIFTDIVRSTNEFAAIFELMAAGKVFKSAIAVLNQDRVVTTILEHENLSEGVICVLHDGFVHYDGFITEEEISVGRTLSDGTVEVPRDGNCFYHALKIAGRGQSVSELRNIIADYLLENFDQFETQRIFAMNI